MIHQVYDLYIHCWITMHIYTYIYCIHTHIFTDIHIPPGRVCRPRGYVYIYTKNTYINIYIYRMYLHIYVQWGRSTRVLGNIKIPPSLSFYLQVGRSTRVLGNINLPPPLKLTPNPVKLLHSLKIFNVG